MFNLGLTELIVILVIALVVFGPGKLPEVGKAVGRGVHEFRRATSGEEPHQPDMPKSDPPQTSADEKK